MVNEHRCLKCGRLLSYHGTGQPPRFCTPAHKAAYHRAKRGEGHGQATEAKNCPECGKQFVGVKRAIYDTTACKQKAYERRVKKAKAKQPKPKKAKNAAPEPVVLPVSDYDPTAYYVERDRDNR